MRKYASGKLALVLKNHPNFSCKKTFDAQYLKREHILRKYFKNTTQLSFYKI